jgi:hypothetical protein
VAALPDHGGAEAEECGGAGALHGRGARVGGGGAQVVRAQGSGVPLMGRRNSRHAGPGAGGVEIPAAGCTAVAEGKGEEADQWAPVGRERKEERVLGLGHVERK